MEKEIEGSQVTYSFVYDTIELGLYSIDEGSAKVLSTLNPLFC